MRDIKKVDAKGRFFIPSKQKETIGEEVVVTNSLDVGYLCVYSKDHFENVVKTQLGKLNGLDRLVFPHNQAEAILSLMNFRYTHKYSSCLPR